jgi:hypothetical protein
MHTCLNCGKTENEKPLLVMKFKGQEIYICPQCLPVLIHKPATLAEKIPGAENFGASHEH